MRAACAADRDQVCVRLTWKPRPPRRRDDCQRRASGFGLPGRRPVAGRVRPQGDPARRARDAGADGDARRVRGRAAVARRPDHRLAPHDHPDRRPDRDARRAGSRGPLGLVQHLLDAGSRRGGGGGGAAGNAGGAARGACLCLEGRDARGVLVVHRAGAQLAGAGRERKPRAEHDPRRRRRCDPARAQGRRVRAGGRRAGSGRGRRRRSSASSSRCSSARSPRTRPAGHVSLRESPG